MPYSNETHLPIRTKMDMYRRLGGGEFGNTIPVFYSVEEWENNDCPNYGLWGIRSVSAAGDPRMRLNVPAEEIPSLFRSWYPNGGGNISCMIDRWAVLRAEVFEQPWAEPFGLSMFYVPPGQVDPDSPWRGSFRKYGRSVGGVLTQAILQNYLWPSDYEDLKVLLDRFPGHVIEFSACDRAVGLIPNRNTVIWEVRAY